MPMDRDTLIGRVGLDHTTQQIADVLADPDYGRRDLQRVARFRTTMAAPLLIDDEVVGAMVRRLLAEGRDFTDLTPEEWRQASDLFGADAPGAATARASVGAKRTPQSTSPTAVAAALAECRSWAAANT